MRFPLRSLPVGAGTWLLLTAACTAIRTVEPAELSPPNPPSRVWVTRADHSTAVVDAPRVSADTLIGMVNGWPERLPLSAVTVLRVRERSPDRTAGLVFVGVSAVMGLWCISSIGRPRLPPLAGRPLCACSTLEVARARLAPALAIERAVGDRGPDDPGEPVSILCQPYGNRGARTGTTLSPNRFRCAWPRLSVAMVPVLGGTLDQ